MKKLFDYFIKKKWFLIIFTRFIILPFFNSHPLSKKLKSVLNSKSKKIPNPTHMERDIFIHSLMVLDETLKHKDVTIVDVLASLTHDAGKIYSKTFNQDTGRIAFTNHEHISTYIGGRFLLDFYNKYKYFIRFSYIKDAIMVITWHGIYKYNIDDIKKKYKDYAIELIRFHISDLKGRIVREDLYREVKDDVLEYYNKNYNKPKNNIKPFFKNKLYFYNGVFTSVNKTMKLKTNELLATLKRDDHYANKPIIAIDYQDTKDSFVGDILYCLEAGFDVVIVNYFNKYKLEYYINELKSKSTKLDFDQDIKIVSLIHIPSKSEERAYVNFLQNDKDKNDTFIKSKSLYVPDFTLVDGHKIIHIRKV